MNGVAPDSLLWPLHVEPVETDDSTATAAEWDAFVESRPGATFCHLFGWRHIMTEVMGHPAPYLTARDDEGALVGVLPLVRVRSRLLGDYLLSMPFLNYGGPLGDEPVRARLARSAARAAKAAGVDLMELRTRDAIDCELPRSDRKITVLLDLPDTPEELFEERFKAKLRAQIRRPMKEGMEVRFGSDQVEPFYEVFSRNMRDLGTPVLSKTFFHAAAGLFEERVLVAVVYHRGEPVASGFGFMFGDEFEITWASAVREYNHLSPNMLLYWGMMEECIRRGVGTFNFGRCTPGGGTHRFKRQWGGRDVGLPWHLDRSEPAGVASDSMPRRLAATAWQHAPLAVANWIGPRLSRSLPL